MKYSTVRINGKSKFSTEDEHFRDKIMPVLNDELVEENEIPEILEMFSSLYERVRRYMKKEVFIERILNIISSVGISTFYAIYDFREELIYFLKTHDEIEDPGYIISYFGLD